jgi:hypothetical protein
VRSIADAIEDRPDLTRCVSVTFDGVTAAASEIAKKC